MMNDYSKFDIDVTLSRYGLFDGVQWEANGEQLDAAATREKMAQATKQGLDKIYPGASIGVSYQCDELTATAVSVSGGTDDENNHVQDEVTETLETVELFDFSDPDVWVYTPVAG